MTIAEKIVAELEKLGRASRVQLGTDQKTMEALEAEGVVARDGTIDTGSRGRPPIAWILADAEKVTEVEISKPTKRGSPEHKAKMDEGKRKAKEQREKQQKAERKAELKELKASAPKLEKKYDASLKDCRKAKTEDEIQSAFDRSDSAMNALISTNRRIQTLESEIAA